MEEENKNGKSNVEVKKDASPDTLREIAETLLKLQTDIEPIKERARDEKNRMLGFSQCAEQIITIIAARASDLANQANETEQKVLESRGKNKKTRYIINELGKKMEEKAQDLEQ